jgi:hypothetical protein
MISGKKWKGLHITIRVKPEVGWNGPSLCGIESLYNGLSKTTTFLDILSKINKIRVSVPKHVNWVGVYP